MPCTQIPYFLIYILTSPHTLNSHSKTLINNIFTNNIAHGGLSENITTTMSDHYAQFLLIYKKIKTKNNLLQEICVISQG